VFKLSLEVASLPGGDKPRKALMTHVWVGHAGAQCPHSSQTIGHHGGSGRELPNAQSCQPTPCLII